MAALAPFPSASPAQPRPDGRWYLIPIGAVVLCAIPNLTLVVLAKKAHLARSDERPYQASQQVDHDKAQRVALAAAGGGFTVDQAEGRLRLGYHGPALTGVSIELQRPDDAAGDRRLAWADPAVPLVLVPERTGGWRLRIRGDRGAGEAILHDTPFEWPTGR